MSRIVGIPRKTSVYAAERSRSGKKTGPCRLRSTASTRPHTRMNTSAVRNSFTFVQNFSRMSGKDSLNSGQ